MTKNIKKMFFVLTLITLLVTVGAVCAADDANSTTTVDSSVSDATISNTASDTVAAEPVTTNSNDNKVDTKTIEKENNNQPISSLNKEFKNLKTKNDTQIIDIEGGKEARVTNYIDYWDEDIEFKYQVYYNGTMIVNLDTIWQSLIISTNGATRMQIPMDNMGINVTDIIVNINCLDSAEFFPNFDLCINESNFNCSNIDITYVNHISSSNTGYNFSTGSYKTTTFEGFNLVKDASIIGDNIILKNSNIILGGIGSNSTIENCNMSYTMPIARHIIRIDKNNEKWLIYDGPEIQSNNILRNNKFSYTTETKSTGGDIYTSTRYENGTVIIEYIPSGDMKVYGNPLPIIGNNNMITNNSFIFSYLSGITIEGMNNTLENNSVLVRHYDNTINVTGSNNTIRYNNLTNKENIQGDITVLNNGENNIIKDNLNNNLTNETVEDDPEFVNITTENIQKYFSLIDNEMYIGNKIISSNKNLTLNIQYFPENINLILLDENNEKFENRTLKIIFDENISLNNVGIDLESNFKVITLENIEITYDNNYSDNTFINIDSYLEKAILKNVTVNLNKEDVTSAIIFNIAKESLVENCNINAKLKETAIGWESGPNIPSALGVYVSASNCILNNNTFNISSSGSTGDYSSLFDVCIKASNTTFTNNNLSLYNGTGYLYGLVVRGNNNTVSLNNINVSSHSYANGVNLEMSNFANNIVNDNNISVTASYGNAPWGNPAVAYAMQMLDFNYHGGTYYSEGDHPNNNSFINNTINGIAGQIYGIEIYGGNNINLSENNINITGRTPMGIGVIGENITIANNNIITNGTYNTSEGTADYLEAINTGIYDYLTTNGINITNNTVATNNGPGIIIKESHNTIITDNIINTSNHDYTIEINGIENTVENNTLTSRINNGSKTIKSSETNNILDNHDVIDQPKEKARFTRDYSQPQTMTLNPGEKWENMGVTVYGSNWEELTGKQIDILIDGEYNTTTTVQQEAYPYARYTYTATTPGQHTITFQINDTQYEGNYTFNVTVIEPPKEYFLKVETTNFTQGTNTTIIATIKYGNEISAEIATNISKGKITFKVNGKTLKDANGKVIYAKVINGVATIENYVVPDDWSKDGTTIQAVYSGSTQCDKLTSEKTELNITSPETTLTITPITSDVQTGSTVTLKAKVAIGDKAITTGKIVFKINGKTVKDANGKVIYAKVDANGEASVDYTIPESFKAGTYNIEAVFTASGYEKLTDNTTMTVVKS